MNREKRFSRFRRTPDYRLIPDGDQAINDMGVLWARLIELLEGDAAELRDEGRRLRLEIELIVDVALAVGLAADLSGEGARQVRGVWCTRRLGNDHRDIADQ